MSVCVYLSLSLSLCGCVIRVCMCIMTVMTMPVQSPLPPPPAKKKTTYFKWDPKRCTDPLTVNRAGRTQQKTWKLPPIWSQFFLGVCQPFELGNIISSSPAQRLNFHQKVFMDSEGISNTHLPRHGRKSFRNECPRGIAAAWQINPSRHNLNITMTSLDAGNSPVKLICFLAHIQGYSNEVLMSVLYVFFLCVCMVAECFPAVFPHFCSAYSCICFLQAPSIFAQRRS